MERKEARRHPRKEKLRTVPLNETSENAKRNTSRNWKIKLEYWNRNRTIKRRRTLL
jgi:hypothetical protein